MCRVPESAGECNLRLPSFPRPLHQFDVTAYSMWRASVSRDVDPNMRRGVSDGASRGRRITIAP
jgi:hypothetical protein